MYAELLENEDESLQHQRRVVDAATALNRVVTVGTAQLPSKPNHILLAQVAATEGVRRSVDNLNESVESLTEVVETLGSVVMVGSSPVRSHFEILTLAPGSS